MNDKQRYLGMPLEIPELDQENRQFFKYCASGELRLQSCRHCDLMRYPPGPTCPWCAGDEFKWVRVGGKGTVYSYTEIRHAIQPAFRTHVPYLALLVELDEQRGRPSDHEALRMIGNLASPDATLAPPTLVQSVGIGTRVKVVFAAVDDEIAIPLWTPDEATATGEQPWRYPE